MTVPTAPARLGAAPTPPGSLTVPPTSAQALSYIEALDRWVTALRAALDGLDASAQVAHDPAVYTQDIVLAMSLWNSIDVRRNQLIKTWDSGRVLANELATIGTLIWGRLADPLGNPSAFTLPEACVLAAALQDRLTATLSIDAVAGSGAGARVAPLRAALIRCRRQAEALGLPTQHIDELSAQLERVITGSDPKAIAATVNRIDTEVTLMERDLIKEASARAGLPLQCAELRRRHDDLAAKTVALRELAERCTEKMANPPRLGIPSIAALGEPPEPGTNANGQDWEKARAIVEEYAARLGRYGAAVAEATERYRAPLEERDDLRGLLGAYRSRASAKGLAEDAALDDHYEAARTALFTAPCDLGTARALVVKYQDAVRVALGDAHATEPSNEPSNEPRKMS